MESGYQLYTRPHTVLQREVKEGERQACAQSCGHTDSRYGHRNCLLKGLCLCCCARAYQLMCRLAHPRTCPPFPLSCTHWGNRSAAPPLRCAQDVHELETGGARRTSCVKDREKSTHQAQRTFQRKQGGACLTQRTPIHNDVCKRSEGTISSAPEKELTNRCVSVYAHPYNSPVAQRRRLVHMPSPPPKQK